MAKRPTIRPLVSGQRFMFVSDNHGNEADPTACRAALDFAADFKPHIRIHGGDGVNLDALRVGATEDERCGGLNDDMAAATEFNRLYKPHYYLMGNHCHRLHRAMNSPRKMMAELAIIMWDSLRKSLGNATVFPYCKRRGVLRLGDFSFIHGYSSGVYAVRKAALSYGNVIMGHVHRVDMQPVERLDGAVGYAAGCLCRLDLDYNRGKIGTLSQEHGFIYGHISKGGQCSVWHARKVDGHWVFPTEFKTYG